MLHDNDRTLTLFNTQIFKKWRTQQVGHAIQHRYLLIKVLGNVKTKEVLTKIKIRYIPSFRRDYSLQKSKINGFTNFPCIASFL